MEIVLYHYSDCLAILNCPAACIPPQNNTGLNEHALLIAGKLARFRNMPDHAIAKKAACEMHRQLKPAPIKQILTDLLNKSPVGQALDWVKQVGRKLPVLTILKGFDFNNDDCDLLTAAIPALVKIMQPAKNIEIVEKINEVSEPVYQVIEKHILRTEALNAVVSDLCAEFSCSREEALAIGVANVAGLLTQSYDACSGLLSHALRYAVTMGQRQDFPKFVTEVLRYDPPVLNTRRVAAENIMLDNMEIKEGENILLVLAAANRDERQFKQANSFDIDRSNNATQLTFGAGMHACLASQFAINMAAETLHHFFAVYPDARLLSNRIAYEPIINARLPVSLLVSLI